MPPPLLLRLSCFDSAGCCKRLSHVPVAAFNISTSPNECNVAEIREQVETLASLMAESEDMVSQGSSSALTQFVISSRQTLCFDPTADAEEEHEAEDGIYVSLSKASP